MLKRRRLFMPAGADPNAPREFRGHRTVDVRMYDQLVASRNRMSQNLSRANKVGRPGCSA